MAKKAATFKMSKTSIEQLNFLSVSSGNSKTGVLEALLQKEFCLWEADKKAREIKAILKKQEVIPCMVVVE